jgi:uncharacterized protein
MGIRSLPAPDCHVEITSRFKEDWAHKRFHSCEPTNTMQAFKTSRFNLFFPELHPNQTVVYNSLSRGLSLLESDLAEQLKRSEPSSEAKLKSFSKDEIDDLRKAGFLLPINLDEKSKLTHRFYQTRFQTTSLELQILFTSQCNFSCPYCYQDTLDSTKPMSREKWAGIHTYIKTQIDHLGMKYIKTYLFGGEPLLPQEVTIQAANELAAFRKQGITVENTLITNGSLLTSSLIKHLGTSLDTVQLTVDGPENRHNELRPYRDGRPSYRDVMKAVSLCVKSSIPNVVVRINLHPEDADEVRSFINHLAGELSDLSRVGLSFSRIESTLSERHSIFEAKPDLDNYILMRSLAAYSVQEGFRTSVPVIPSGTCTAQRASSLVIDQDLNVFNCEAQMSHSPRARLSENGSLSILHDEWFHLSNHIPDCVYACPFGPLCGGGCPIYPLATPTHFPECDNAEYYTTKVKDVLRARLQVLLDS